MAAQFVVELEERGFRLATSSCLVLILWGRDPLRDDLERISALQRALVAEHGYCVSLSVVPDKLAVKIGDGVREASADNLREFADTNLGAAVVVAQGGMRATLVRTLITGIQLIAFAPIKQRVFSSTRDALAWLAARPKLRPEHAAELVELDAEIRALIAQATA